MMLDNRDIVLQSRETLKAKWGVVIGGTVLYWILLLVLGSVPYLGILSCIIMGPMAAGLALFFLKLIRNETPEIADVFSGFSNFLNAMVARLLVLLFTVLWALLLIVPGIIAAYGYSQTMYIVAENPTMTGPDALRQSKAMMKGFKWKLFCLQCRYIGWAILGVVTFGIGLIWVLPMIYAAKAKFYDELRTDYEARTPKTFADA